MERFIMKKKKIWEGEIKYSRDKYGIHIGIKALNIVSLIFPRYNLRRKYKGYTR